MKKIIRTVLCLTLVLATVLVLGTLAGAKSGPSVFKQPSLDNEYTATFRYAEQIDHLQWFEVSKTMLSEFDGLYTINVGTPSGINGVSSVDDEGQAVGISFTAGSGLSKTDVITFECDEELTVDTGTLVDHMGNVYQVQMNNRAFYVMAENPFELKNIAYAEENALVDETTATLTSGHIGNEYYLVAYDDGDNELCRTNTFAYIAPDVLYSTSLTLQENIDINFYVKIKQDAPVAYYDVRVSAEFDNLPTVDDYLDVDANFVGLKQDANGEMYNYYKVRVASVNSFDMTKTCDIEVFYDLEPVKSVRDYSVQTYCMNKLNKTLVSQELKDLCTAVLDYGANAQLYFDGKTYWEGDERSYQIDIANLANKYSNPSNTVPTHPGSVGMAASKSMDLNEVSATLLLGSETKLKIYFKAASPASKADIYQDGDTLLAQDVPVLKDPQHFTYYVKTPGLTPLELMRSYYFDMDDSNWVNYSPLNYIANHSTGELGNLCSALYAYADAAANYVASLDN